MILAFKELTDHILDVGDILLWLNLFAAIAATVVNVWSYFYYAAWSYRALKLFRAGVAAAYVGIFASRLYSGVIVGPSQYIGLGVALASWVCVFMLPSLVPPPKNGAKLLAEAIERIKIEDGGET